MSSTNTDMFKHEYAHEDMQFIIAANEFTLPCHGLTVQLVSISACILSIAVLIYNNYVTRLNRKDPNQLAWLTLFHTNTGPDVLGG